MIEGWTATYPDPIQVSAGDILELSGREDLWDGYRWLWAKNTQGKEGWIPDAIVSKTTPASATETYSALEISSQKGQTLIGHRTLHGWVLCSDQAGQIGWVPERNLKIVGQSDP